MKSVLALFSLLLISSTATAAVVCTAEQKTMAESLLLPENQTNEKLTLTLYKSAHQDAVAEIESEAKDLNIDRDTYVDSGASFSRFISNLKKIDFTQLDDAEVVVMLFKIGARLKIQSTIRFPGEDFESNIAAVLKIVEPLKKRIGLKF